MHNLHKRIDKTMSADPCLSRFPFPGIAVGPVVALVLAAAAQQLGRVAALSQADPG